MDRIEDLLRRIRDPRACVELLLAAPGADAGHVAQQLAAVLSSLRAVHRELGGSSPPGPAGGGLGRPRGGPRLFFLYIAFQPQGALPWSPSTPPTPPPSQI